jgi:hypothetical protein
MAVAGLSGFAMSGGAAAGAAAREAAPAGPLVTVRDARITESSGLAASPSDPDVVWTVNDSGDSARAFAVSLRTGRTVAVLRERTDARDCEAMTSGRDSAGRAMLWIGDIGDNRGVRTSVVLRLIREPDPVRSTTVTPVDLRVRYPGGPADAETLIWTHDGRLLIVTKEIFGGDVLEVPPAAVRRALAGRSVETPALARKVGSVDQGLPTDGVALPDGRVVVRDYEGATVYAPPAYDGRPLAAQTRLSWPLQDQGETIAAIVGGRAVVVGSEGEHEALLRVDVPRAPSARTSTASSKAGSVPRHPTADQSGPPGTDRGRLVGAGLVVIALVTASAGLGYVWRARARAGRGH